MNSNNLIKPVDIIIPVYNALDDLKICLDSLKKHTDLDLNRVIIINDNSPDPNVKLFLDSLDYSWLKVIHNDTNKGFSANINLGMSQSEERDVVLLNSDTVLTSNWLPKIVRCAYSSSEIGTVTPVSNNATLCSVPNFCEENVLPENISIDKAAEIVERCSFHEYPQITVAIGFCMFVKREVIKCIGGFDAETFQRGYGEENDFCNRAEQMGYIHVMCDDTYIYHSGTKSFVSKEKEQYIREHDKILQKRYPVQMHRNAVHCATNPNAHIGKNVGLYFGLENGKKNLLYYLHSDFCVGKNDSIGGTQFHVRDLKNGMLEEYNIYVVARNGEYITVTGYVGEQIHHFDFWVGEAVPFIPEKDRKIRKVLNDIIEAFDIQLIHVHHVIDTSLDIFSLAKEKNIPVVLTAHDFYYICPTTKLLNSEGKFCSKCKVDQECITCLRKTIGTIDTIDYLSLWQKKSTKIFEICEKIVFPSESAKQIYAQVYPQFSDKYVVIEHGVNRQLGEAISYNEEKLVREEFIFGIESTKISSGQMIVDGWINAYQMDPENERLLLEIDTSEEKYYIPLTLSLIDYTRGIVSRFIACVPGKLCEKETLKAQIVIASESQLFTGQTEPVQIKGNRKLKKKKLRVAFIGGLDVSKGSGVVYDIVKKGSKDVQWYTFGTIGDEKLENLKQDNYVSLGTYNQKDLPALLKMHEIDVIGILSIWPETYSYTMSEAILNGIPVIVSDIGALGERQKKLNAGWTVSVDNIVEDFVKVTNNILNDMQGLEEIKKRVCNINLKTLTQMNKDYSILYKECQEKRPNRHMSWEYDKQKIYNTYYYRNDLQTKSTGDNVIGDEQKQQYMRDAEELRILKTTLTYQLMIKIIHMRMPFKQQIMKVVYKIWKRN
ncbi:glycosyltransferase [Blautia sp. HCP3S3_H10_1]|uniref:glycosyltransferase n=1 Tax=unclassified Blautia TaxID=2648079 RepID=UPI003F92B11C